MNNSFAGLFKQRRESNARPLSFAQLRKSVSEIQSECLSLHSAIVVCESLLYDLDCEDINVKREAARIIVYYMNIIYQALGALVAMNQDAETIQNIWDTMHANYKKLFSPDKVREEMLHCDLTAAHIDSARMKNELWPW